MCEDKIREILKRVDPDELVEILGLTTEDLLDISDIREMVEGKSEKFDYLGSGEV